MITQCEQLERSAAYTALADNVCPRRGRHTDRTGRT